METKLVKKINYFEPGGLMRNPLLRQVEAQRQKNNEMGAELTKKAVQDVRNIKQRADVRKKATIKARKRNGILNDVVKLQDELYKQGYFGDIPYEKAVDGVWGKATQDAYSRSRLKQDKENNSETDQDSSITSFLQRNPLTRTIKHTAQTISNQMPKVSEEFQNGNYGKATAALLGAPLDIVTSIPSNTFGYNMYTAPIKDILNSQYNRAVRNITGDQNYTAIKGQTYDQYDMSKGMWDTAIEMQQRVANGEDSRAVAHAMAKERVDPTYDYTSAQLLLHPFNDTANYLWTIGGQGEATGDYYADTFDNNKDKTQSYLKSFEQGWTDGSSMGKQLGRAMRGFGGLVTSQDEDPNEQKQTTLIPKQKKK